MSEGATLRGSAMFAACWAGSKAMDLSWTVEGAAGGSVGMCNRL